MTSVVLGGRAEDRAYAQIIGAQCLSTFGRLDRVGRQTQNQVTGQLAHVVTRYVALAEVHTVRACRTGKLDGVVHNERYAVFLADGRDLTR